MVKNKGFTLIELMIVAAIIGILAAIAIPAFQNQHKALVCDGKVVVADAKITTSAHGAIFVNGVLYTPKAGSFCTTKSTDDVQATTMTTVESL